MSTGIVVLAFTGISMAGAWKGTYLIANTRNSPYTIHTCLLLYICSLLYLPYGSTCLHVYPGTVGIMVGYHSYTIVTMA